MSRWKVDGLYVNLDPGEPADVTEVWKWRRERRRTGWAPTGAPPTPVPPDLGRIRDPPGPQATWIGHATYLLQLDGKNVLTDPIFGNAGLRFPKRAQVPRAVPPGVAFEDLPSIDLVLVSHNHYDHLDAATFARIPRTTPILAPDGLASWFRRRGFRDVHEMEWWASTRVAGLDATAVPAQHWSRRGMFDARKSHWCGFVLDAEVRTYFAGDSAYFSGFREIGARLAPKAALLPIGAYEPRWFMKRVHADPDEAVQAMADVRATKLLPMHWGTFRLTDEPLDEPPQRLFDLWKAKELPPSGLALSTIGETVRL